MVMTRYFLYAATEHEQLLAEYQHPHFVPRLGEKVYLPNHKEYSLERFVVKDVVHGYTKNGHDDMIDVFLEFDEIPMQDETTNTYDGYYHASYTEGMV